MDHLVRRHGHGGHSTAGIGLMNNTKTGDPWAGQMKYSKGVVAIGSIVVLLAALLAIPSRLRYRRLQLARSGKEASAASSSATGGGRTWRRLASLGRYLAYRRLPSYRLAFLDLRLPALGITLLLTLLMAGITAWMFAVQPYYRVSYTFGSPPLALRSGMMSIGLMPFVYVLGTKVNFISMLTGTSHERLQVYHQWTARFMLFLATVHTIPFINQPLREGGTGALKEWFFSDHINTTGTVAYACLCVLVFGSFVGLRERCYQLFVAVHIPVAVTFLAFMFIHSSQLLTSWRYLWATATLYMLSVFFRIARQLVNHSLFSLCQCRIEALDDDLTRLTIRTRLHWRPGQHVFVRFPTVEPWSAHPFTIVSLPRHADRQVDSTIVLMARARGGLTRKLYALAVKARSDAAKPEEDGEQLLRPASSVVLPAIVDGAYGSDAGVADYDEVLYVAGGSGVTLVMASLLDLCWQWRQGSARTRRAKLVWTVRSEQAVGWMQEHIETIESLAPEGALSVTVHISRSSEVGAGSPPAAATLPSSWHVVRGERPDVVATVDEIVASAVSSPRSASPGSNSATSDATSLHALEKEVKDLERADAPSDGTLAELRSSSAAAAAGVATGGTTVAVVVCGPEGLSNAASNAVARIELDMARGRRPGLDEVFLIDEQFGW